MAFGSKRRAEAERLQALLVDYAETRDDERTHVTTQTALIAVTLTAVTVAGGVAFGALDVRASPLGDLILLVLPTLAVVPLLFLIRGGVGAIWRSYYLRALERELRESVQGRLRSFEGLSALAYAELEVAASAGRGSSSFGALRVILAFTYPVVVIVVGGTAIMLATQVSDRAVQLLMLLIYGGGGVGVLSYISYAHIRGRAYFRTIVDRFRERSADGLMDDAVPREGRSTISYFLVPRPDELATKSVFVVLGVAGALTLTGQVPTWPDLLRCLLLWLIVEYLVYQARYQWNDIRGFEADTRSAARVGRGRLPNIRAARPISWAIIAVRLYLVLVVTAIGVPGGVLDIAMVAPWSIVAVFGTAIVYEWIRSKAAGRPREAWLLLPALYVVVGLGYTVRFTLGFVSVDVSWSAALLLGGCACWMLGIYFVALTWLIEGLDEMSSTRQRRQSGNTGRDSTKSHLAALVRRSGAASHSSPATRLIDLPRVPALPVRLAAAGWFALAPATLVALVGGWAFADARAVLSMVGAVVILIVPYNGRSLLIGLALAGLCSCAAGIFGAGVSSSFPAAAILSAIAAVVPLLLFAGFARSTYADTRAVVAKAWLKSRAALVRLYEIASAIPRRSEAPR